MLYEDLDKLKKDFEDFVRKYINNIKKWGIQNKVNKLGIPEEIDFSLSLKKVKEVEDEKKELELETSQKYKRGIFPRLDAIEDEIKNMKLTGKEGKNKE